jgi:hypothetical protein
MNWSESNPAHKPPGTEEQIRAALSKAQWLSLLIGLIALALCAAAAVTSDTQRESFYRAYLYGYVFWVGLALGSGGIAMIHNLTSGRWGLAARRVAEAANGNILLMVVLAIPLAMGVTSHHMYSWAGYGPDPHLGPHKTVWLTPHLVVMRLIICLAIWLVTSFMISTGSRRVEATGRFSVASIFAGMSGFGLIFYVLSFTVFTVDWIMSITPAWYSTMFTLIFIMGQMLSAFSFAVLMLSILIRYEPVHGKISMDQVNDLSSFMFAFVVLWSYMSFAQLLITWMGNLRPEMAWYHPRMEGKWEIIGIILMLLQFLAPFLILLNKPIKRNPGILLWVALGLLIMRFIDLLWLIKPGYPSHRVSWMDPLAAVGIGGIFIFFFIRRLTAGRLAPPPLVNEYTAAEALGHPGLLGATEYGAAISHRKGPIP